MLFEFVNFTNEMANHFGFDKGSLGIEIKLFYDSKKKQKSRNHYNTLHQKLTMKIVNNNISRTYQFKYFCSVLRNTRTVEQVVLYKRF